MARPAKLADLPPAEWNHWQAVLDRFEQAWRDGDAVDLEAYLPPPGDPVRPLVLQELIKSELEVHWRRGRQVVLEDYLTRFPELAQDQALWPALLFEEYRVRRLYGDRPDLGVYSQRFPEQFGDLTRLLREEGPPTSPSTVNPVPPTVAPDLPTKPSPAPPGNAGPMGIVNRESVLPVGGGYKLIERLGSGQFGEVWRAEAPGGVEVAVKVIFRPLQHADAQRELEALAVVKKLRHTFLVQVQAYWALEDRLVIAMELADSNLRSRLKECRRAGEPGIPPSELLLYLREAAEALDFLHANHVLHRDIKPDNVLLIHRHAKLADLGLARMFETTQSFTATTCGSPPYMAPEVWVQRACSQSDQYSLAASYVELRTGRMLFAGHDWVQLMLAHREGKPDLAGLPEAEQAVLERALAKEPADRFPTCLEFAQALERALSGAGAAAEDRPPPGRVGATPLPPPHAGSRARPGSRPSYPDTAEVGPATLAGAGRKASGWHPRSGVTRPAGTGRAWRAESGGGVGRLLPWVVVGLGVVGLLGVLYWLMRGPADGGRPGPSQSELTTERTAPGPEAAGEALLPPGCVAADGTRVKQLGKASYYDRIIYRLKDGTPVAFLLVIPQFKEEPFYIMETKVSNRMFRQYVKERPVPPSISWTKGGEWDGKDTGIGDRYLDCPVYRVPWGFAHDFAKWLGGDLPTARQWDTAAGLWDDSNPPGPFEGSLQKLGQEGFALKATGPLPVGTAARDRSCYGCRDMASNGLEWTCSPGEPGKEGDKLTGLGPPGTLVLLRGASYASTEPLTFERLKRDPETREQTRDPDLLSDVSFRVVLPLPAGRGGPGS